MDMIKMEINGRMYDVVNLDEYQKNPDAFVPEYTAIRSFDGKYALPVVSITDSKPGMFVTNCIAHQRLPKEEELVDYNIEEKAINLSDSKTIGELMEKQEAVRDIEKEILTDVDNIYTPKIGPTDSKAIKALKEAVIDKHIDLDKYGPRFGPNFNNDKRLLSKDNISLQMLLRMCNALDIKATLILEDESPDVPNPMGTTIVTELTKESDND